MTLEEIIQVLHELEFEVIALQVRMKHATVDQVLHLGLLRESNDPRGELEKLKARNLRKGFSPGFRVGRGRPSTK